MLKLSLKKSEILKLCALMAAVILLFSLASQVSASPLFQTVLPSEGWSVCQDLGVIQLPGGGEPVQQMVMCSGEGWRIHVFCTEPQKPAPALNTSCSMVNSTDFWCGDTVQVLRQYEVLATPAATETATPTNTPLPTSTPTPTATPTLTTTPQPSVTPSATLTAVSQTPPSTPFVRPPPGGPGSPQLFFSILAILGGSSLMAASFLLGKRRSGISASRQ